LASARPSDIFHLGAHLQEDAHGVLGEPEFSADGIGGISAAWVELNLDAMWQPVVATFDRRMAGVLRVELPEQWDLVSSGTVTREGDAFVVRSTVLLSDVPFVAAPRLSRVRAAGFEVSYRVDDEAAAAVLVAADACASYLNREFGDARPLPPGRIVIADRPGGGYARTNYIVLNEVSADRRGLHHYLCHELAHFWSDSEDFRSPEHWMSEAFAEYVAARASMRPTARRFSPASSAAGRRLADGTARSEHRRRPAVPAKW
jgi:hypothetical protein